MTSARQHRELIDAETLVRRTYLVSVIVDAMRFDPAWKDAGDIIRRRTARRIAFARWVYRTDRIDRATPGHERRGWEGR